MRAVTIDSDLATLFTFTPRKPPITPIQEVGEGRLRALLERADLYTSNHQPDAHYK